MKQCCKDTFIKAFEEVITSINEDKFGTRLEIANTLQYAVNLLKRFQSTIEKRAGIDDESP
jgi:hypothetical protein